MMMMQCCCECGFSCPFTMSEITISINDTPHMFLIPSTPSHYPHTQHNAMIALETPLHSAGHQTNIKVASGVVHHTGRKRNLPGL
jgi:hypothetical protein